MIDTTYNFSDPLFSSDAAGAVATGTFTSGQTPTFSAGTDAADNTYTVNIDTAVVANGVNFQEGNVTLAAGAGTLTLTGAGVNVEPAVTALISETISGTVGLNKTSAGSLTLTGANDYTGTTTISAGTLSISSNGNLGAIANDIALGSGTLRSTAPISLDAGRDLTGTGSLAPTAGTVLTFNGLVNAGTVTIADTGTVALGTTGVTKALTGLSFSSAGTVAVTGTALSLPGNITTTHGAGTATLSGPVDFGSGTRTVTVADGSAGVDLLLSGNLSGASVLQKLGDGTLQLTGDNSGLTGFGTTTPASLRIGLSGTTPANGGTVSFTTATALGAGQVQFNGGTLRDDSAGPLVLANSLSIGAREAATTPGGAIFAGGNIEFTANGSGFFGNFAHQVTVNNTTTLSGTVTGSGGASSSAVIIGTGSLVLSGAAPNTFTEAVTVGGTATLNGVKQGALGANTVVTVNTGGTLLLSGDSAVTDRINNNAAVNLAGGTFNTGGLSEGTAPTAPGNGLQGLGLLTLSANSTLDFGTAQVGSGSALVFNDFDNTFGPGITLTINNYNGMMGTDNGAPTNDRLLFVMDPGLSSAQLSQINFTGYEPGAAQIVYNGQFEILPVPEPATVFGGLALVGLIGYRERRRLAGLCGRATR